MWIFIVGCTVPLSVVVSACRINFFYLNVSHEQYLFPVEAHFHIIHHKHLLYPHTHALSRTGHNNTPHDPIY